MERVPTCVVVTLKVKGNAAALGGQCPPPTSFLAYVASKKHSIQTVSPI